MFGSMTVFVRFKSSAVDAVGIIENDMKMRMLLVNMASHEILIFAFKKLLTYLLTDLQCPFGKNFPRLKIHNEVLSKNGTSARSVSPYFFIVKVSLFRIRAAALCENQSAIICLFGICNIFQRCKLIN